MTWEMVAVAPRSTWIHCGSVNALDQRVAVLPSTALVAGVPAFSVDEAVAGLPCDSSVSAAPARTSGSTTIVATSVVAAAITPRRAARERDGGCMGGRT